jgi:short-subunit dehydrogenase
MNIVITGGSKGIGKAIALQFAGEGNQLLLGSRNAAQLAGTANEIKNAFPQVKVHTMAADLSIREGVTAFGDWCNKLGAVDILVNNAGNYLPGNVSDEPEGTLEQMIATNLYSAYHLTRALLPPMIRNGKGHIFNMCSIASLSAYPGGGAYSISKFALYGFSKNLREELKPAGIKVTAILPGAVLTDSWDGFDNSNDRIMEADDIARMVFSAANLGPSAVVEDIIIRPQLGDL